MDRTACVDVAALPLQLLLRDRPDWAGRPVVVVDKDKPLGIVQHANGRARECRILPGMRYATGLALDRDLRGGAVPEADVADAVEAIAQQLWAFSPRIEPSAEEPGVFWLDASGLRHVYPSLENWAGQIRRALRETQLHAAVAVGYTRFGSYAAATSRTRNVVFASPAQERAYLRKVPLGYLGMPPGLRDTLLKLGVDTLGGFVDLPAQGIRKRFGPDADRLHRLARGEGWTPLQPQPLFDPPERLAALEYPEGDLERLLLIVDGLLAEVIGDLVERHETLNAIRLDLTLDDGQARQEELAPATPTHDRDQLIGLLRLRLETVSLTAGVVEILLRAFGVEASPRQLDLFRHAPQRNVDAAQQAFAHLRAHLGNDAVCVARLDEGHLPEAQVRWETMNDLPLPEPAIDAPATRPLVRRIYTPPKELPPRDRHEPDGWMIAGLAEGPVEEVVGPHIVSGGWWRRELSRTYHYVRTRSGRWLWIFYDRKRRRWFLQGEAQ